MRHIVKIERVSDTLLISLSAFQLYIFLSQSQSLSFSSLDIQCTKKKSKKNFYKKIKSNKFVSRKQLHKQNGFVAYIFFPFSKINKIFAKRNSRFVMT